MRRIFGRKKEDVRKGRRKFHNEELNDLCSSSGIISVNKLVIWAD
jgi:hypothetical protein